MWSGYLLRLCALLAIVSLTACVNFRPDLPKSPTRSQLEASTATFYTGPVSNSISDYVTYTTQLSAWHQAQADQLRTDQVLTSELGYVGAVVGVIAGASSGHLQAARNGALIAGGTALISDRYQITVQSENYERAADAFLCMRDKLALAEESVREVDKTKTLSQNFEATAPVVANSLSEAVRQPVRTVLRKLRAQQRAIKIAAPDAEQIKAILKKNQSDPLGAQAKTLGDTERLKYQVIVELRQNLDLCAASF